MKTVAFIPVKLNNERLPGKNIKELSDGTPLIQIILNKLLELKGKDIDEIYVYCSDKSIINYLPKGVEFLQRPKSLDGKYVQGKSIYTEFYNTIDADIYVLAHATSPFVSKKHISECINKVKLGGYDSAFCAIKLQTFLWENNKPLNFNIEYPPRTQDISPVFYELSTAYIFTKETFEKYHARTGEKPYICECSAIESIDVDYPDDFEIADAVHTMIKGKKNEQY